MHRRILGAALAMGALLAGQQATQPTSTAATAKQIDAMATSIEQAKQRKPAPTKPVAPAAAQRRVTVASPIIYGPSRYFIEKPQRRKVKYGNRRWVIV